MPNIEKENLFLLDEQQKIRLVIERLGLSSVSQFIPEKRIIEYKKRISCIILPPGLRIVEEKFSEWSAY